MNILIVSQYFLPERFKINDIAQALSKEGHHVRVLTGLPNYPEGDFFPGYGLKGPYREKAGDVEIIRCPLFPRGQKKGWRLALNYLSFMVFSSFLAPFLIRGKVDRIFVYQLSPVTAALPAIILKWVKKCSITFWVTDLWPETLEATGVVTSQQWMDIWGRFVKFLYNHSDKILVTSIGFIDKIAERGIERTKLLYWPQWGEDLFKSIPENATNITGSLPMGFRVMFAGNIGTSQAFETIVEAATILKEYTDVKWLILGDGLMRPWVEQEIVNRNLTEQFFLLGSRPMEEMPAFYSQADVLLASLKKDPLFAITVPAKIQSYLPSGKPIIASMDGEGADLVKNAGVGLSCDASNAEQLADCVLVLHRMSLQERNSMGERGKRYFKENFDREILLKRLVKIMEL